MTCVVEKLAGWAPGVESLSEWKSWSRGEREIEPCKRTPSLKHLPPIARRRLSQLTKMVLETGHVLLEREDSKELPQPYLLFVSTYAEIQIGYKMCHNLIETGEISPATFSASLANVPLSLLSIHENCQEGMSVIVTERGSLIKAFASLLEQLERDSKVLLLFGEEWMPEPYQEIVDTAPLPYAFGLIVSRDSQQKGLSLNCTFTSENSEESSQSIKDPLDFIRWILTDDSRAFETSTEGVGLRIERESK